MLNLFLQTLYYLFSSVVRCPEVELPPRQTSSCDCNMSIATDAWQFTHATFGLDGI
jgi:hypothetical protein